MDHLPVAPTFNYYHPHYTAHQHYHDPALPPLGYRPLQLPLQPRQLQSVERQQFQQQSIVGFPPQTFRPQRPLPHRIRQQTHRRQFMAYQDDLSKDEEFAELQKLSNDYEPEVTGPLVGPRESSTAIATDYASADPVFQAKTAALPQKYSHYRSVRGDGRCGWRSIAFGYFETLVNLKDSNKFLEEETRLRSLCNVLNAAGFDAMLYEDFSDMAFELLRKVMQAVHDGTGPEVLLESFNDEMVQNYVITYLKTLTAAWMKTRPGEYAPWLLGQTVDQYCDESVMPIGSEIENVSLSALKDVLLSPAGVALEVLYLDRTEGSEVNMHRFDPVNHDGFTIGTIRLLYKPGHYDILYKAEDIPPTPTAIPTYLQYASHPHHEPVFDLGVSDFMAMIPGMSFVNPHQAWMSGSTYAGSDFFSPSAPTTQCSQPMLTAVIPSPQLQAPPQSLFVPVTQARLVSSPTQMPQDMAIRTVSHAALKHPAFHHQVAGPFRSSMWELRPNFIQATSHAPTQTLAFRESHFNTAHFLNPEFHPVEWRPDDDYVTPISKGLRHRNRG